MLREKSKYIAVLLSVLLLILCSCQNDNVQIEKEEEDLISDDIKPYDEIPQGAVSFEYLKETESEKTAEEIFKHIIQRSTTAVVAEYVEDKSLEITYRKFKKLDVLYGYAPDEYLYVPINTGSSSTRGDYRIPSGDFTDGEKYLIIAYYRNYFFDPYPEYQLSEDLFIPLDNIENNFASNFKIKLSDEADSSDLINYVKYIADNEGYDIYNTLNIPNIFRGESLNTVVNNCDYIFEIKVDEVLNGQKYSWYHTYSCTVNNVLKEKEGVSYNKNDKITVTALPDSMKAGESYIVVLYDHACNGDYYLDQAADNGIIPVSDFMKVLEVYFYLYTPF